LSRINAAASTGPVAVDDKTWQVLRTAHLFHSWSHGVFDPTVAPQLEQVGFLPKSSRQSPSAKGSFADVELLPGKRVRFQQPGISLDLGGIAKGFAVDQAVSALRRLGIKCGLVNAGGDLRAFGSLPFEIEIRNPYLPGKAFTSFAIKNRALATSAHYFAEQFKLGAQIGPFVHPRLGGFRGALASASVAAKSALTADALTKVVMLDPENSLPLLERCAADSLVCTANGAAFSTPHWHERLQNAA
jgi:thiamine biosynthesis lipoprotein